MSRIILIPLLLIWAISPIHAQLSIYSNEKEITHEIKGVVYALGSRPSDEKSLQTFFTQFQQGKNWQSSDLKTLSLENLSSAICLKIPIDSILAFNSFHYVEDNGVGISSADLVKGVGIKNIEKMMEILGGTCSISSSPGRGFHISVEFNYRINENI